MARIISNSDNVVDSRDVIERIKELERELESFCDENGIEDSQRGNPDNDKWKEWEDSSEAEELETLLSLAEEAEGYASDWKYGETLIRDSYFEEYAEEFVKDIGELPRDLPAWIENNINWKGVAEDIQVDYASVDWGGVTYWIR